MALGDPYIPAGDLALFLKMTVTGNEPELEVAGMAATQWVQGYCRRDFNLATTATARYFDTVESDVLRVDDIGSLTGLAVATDDAQDGTYTTSWSASDLQASPIGAIDTGHPVTEIVAVGSYTYPRVYRRQGLVRVTAQWGWPAIPDAVLQATLILAARIYKRRESAEGVLGFGEFGPVRVGSRIDPDVEALLEKYRLAPRVYAG